MTLVIIFTFFSFDDGFLRRGFDSTTSSGLPAVIRFAFLILALVFLTGVAFLFYRGAKMWRSDYWVSGDRAISGTELKMEAAVILGLGITVTVFVVRGLL